MPEILLIQPPIEDFYLTAKRTVPYGLAGIAAAVRQAGFSVEILDGLATTKSRVLPWPAEFDFLEPFYGRSDRSPFGLFHQFRHFGYSLQHLADQARHSGAFLIGISSLFSAYSDMALQIAMAVKKACPRASVVLGGHHPTALPESVMTHGVVDFVLRGDGECALPQLAKALRQGQPLSEVPGLVRRRQDGTLAINEPAVVKDLGQLPVPAFDLVRWSHYQRAGKASLAISASRGCPMKCTYCTVNAAGYQGFRKRSVDSVMAELYAAARCRPLGFIDFEDEHLCTDKTWFLKLMAAITQRLGHLQLELRAMNGLYAPVMDETVVDAMQRAGFQTLNLALITTDANQLKRFKRPDIQFHLDRVLALAQHRKLKAVAYLIVGGPFQEPDVSVADLLYLAQRRVLAGVSVFYPAPGSYDYDWCDRMRLLPSNFGLMRATALPLAHLTDRLQTVTLLRLGRVLNFIKTIIDQSETLPAPAGVPKTITPHTARDAMGRLLLAGFFKDGLIRGVDAQGCVYAHQTDARLVKTFLQGLQRIPLRGVLR